MYGLGSSPLSIEAAWEHSQHHSHQHPHQHNQHQQLHSQHSQHALNLSHPAHQRLESNQQQHFQFGYSAAFPQYTIPPVSPVSPSTSSISSHSSSSSSASSAEPTTPLGADYLVRRTFGDFNTHSNSGAHGIDIDANNCLPTHQLFDFDFASHLAQGGPPSPTTRVAELEQENTRLKSLASSPSTSPPSSTSHTSSSSSESRTSPTPAPSPEIEQLRAQLAAARTRENELAERLERVKYQAQREQARDREELVRLREMVGSGSSFVSTLDSSASGSKDEGRDAEVVVKEEDHDRDHQSESDTTSSGTSTPVNTVKNLLANPRSGASLGLMVLLCALPSLLSSPSSSTSSSSLPTASSFLDVYPSAFDASSALLPSTDSTIALDWEFDWAGRPRAPSSSRPSSSSSSSTAISHSQTSKMDVDHIEKKEKGWTKLEFDADEAALSDLGLGALDISFETRRAGDGSGRVRVRVHSFASSSSVSSSSTSMSFSSISSSSPHTQQNRNQLSLPTPSHDSDESDEESEDLGPFLTSTPSSASRLSSQSQSLLEGLSLGFGLNNYNNFGMNSMSMGFDSTMGLGMPFASPDYGLNSAISAHANGETRRRVRIALACLPHAGSEGGEWDVLEVAA